MSGIHATNIGVQGGFAGFWVLADLLERVQITRALVTEGLRILQTGAEIRKFGHPHASVKGAHVHSNVASSPSELLYQ